ncbi:DUF1127 domain-containing protein [Agrobacterium vaccinii]|uniref:DUF1127 domain-containing protein n=1 Tax=Agrobacterium vaccinii TaxID=2735528 RepID=UPI001E61C7C8|nr:DUF1127 domain-containing protein [Agrobacterium vaccinii]UHS61512.1 DUF1127 domain-containing protein [Agrobacterium vaccinii]
MSHEQSLRVNDVSKEVDDLFRHFGVWTTFKAVLVVAWQHRQKKVYVSHLSDHMLRDIGLPVSKYRFEIPLLPPWTPRF